MLFPTTELWPSPLSEKSPGIMKKSMPHPITVKLPPALLELLSEEGFELSSSIQSAFQDYLELIRAYNPVVGVVANQEGTHLVSRHLLDSLTLALPLKRYLEAGEVHLDIGSGGGFPAIPLALLFPTNKFYLLERSNKKVGFLRKLLATLPCDNVSVVHGEFPEACEEIQPKTLTARAVEKPEFIQADISSYMPQGACFLAQTTPGEAFSSRLFHVEHYTDWCTTQGWRRGALYLITKT